MTVEKNGRKIAVIEDKIPVIVDVSSALSAIMSAVYEGEANHVAVAKTALAEEFFILSSGLAGEVLQKFVNYRVKVAFYGDFSGYTSKPLRDFIYECNQGNAVLFVSTKEEAVDRLSLLPD